MKVNLRYSDTSFSAHRCTCTETLSYTVSLFNAAICSEHTVYTSSPPDIIYVGSHYAVRQFQTTPAYVVTRLTELLSDSWIWPSASTKVGENTKFVTHFWEMELLNCEWLVTLSVGWYIFLFRFVRFWSGSPINIIVQRELDKIFKLTTGNGIFVQVSIDFINWFIPFVSDIQRL